MPIKLSKQQQAEWNRALKVYQQTLLLEATVDYLLASKAKQTELDGASEDGKE
ncbi:hypothetical protein DOP62_14225 (plasmid) [Synechococcus elongatus PCC 11801]|uniref:Uncharacterized protein n=1 Tax=Synechococcus elongatus PCC 11801 TaxID=2219813 RepID=A0ACD5A307_SYNEL